jgi:DNA repair protein RadC
LRRRASERAAQIDPMLGSDKTPKPDAAPHYHGHRGRLRERFLQGGSDALHDYEMLELILFRAIPRRDVKPLAKELLEEFGSFAKVIAAPVERLKEVDGLGDAAITDLKIVQAAANRLLRGTVKGRQVLSSWSNVLDYCRTAMAFENKEHFRSARPYHRRQGRPREPEGAEANVTRPATR